MLCKVLLLVVDYYAVNADWNSLGALELTAFLIQSLKF